MQLYENASLNFNRRDIRVLELQQANTEDDPIVALLRVQSLEENSKYLALSYTWGEPVSNHSITCNGIDFPITANLFLALKRLRKAGKRFVWVDQICIDQSNLKERGAQVSLMSSIYKNATEVCVWLGTHSEHTGQGIELAKRLAWTAPKDPTQLGHDDHANHIVPRFGSESDPEWSGFYSLFESPWFLRCWVVQEVLAKPNTTVFCGDFEFDWKILPFAILTMWSDYAGHYSNGANAEQSDLADRGMSCCNSMAYEFGDLEKEYPWMNAISDTIMGKAVTAQMDTIDIFLGASRLLATDNRDKVYAFMGLAEGLGDLIKPDYTLTVEETYREFSKKLVNIGLGNSLIATTGTARIGLKNFPTWCLDMSFPDQFMTSIHQYSKAYKWPLRASGDLTGSYVLGPDPSELTVKGITVDTIAAYGPSMLESEGNLSFTTMLHWLQGTRSFIADKNDSSSPRYPTHKSRFQAFCRLVIAEDTHHAHDFEESHLKFARHKLKLHEIQCEPELETRIQALKDLEWPPEVLEYEQVFRNVTTRRKLCITQKGYLGLIRPEAEIGDEICVVLDCKVPLIMRPPPSSSSSPNENKDKDRRLLIGDSYFLDLMNVEALELPDSKVEDIVLQ